MQSSEFINLTVFFLVNSFWANFYIGTFDMQLGDKHNLTGEQRHAFAQTFTLIITLGVLVIPLVGALMDLRGYPATSLLCTAAGIIWALLVLVDSEQRHVLILSFVFYSVFRTSFFTFFFAYLADALGFKFFGMLAGVIFLFGGFLGMLQIPLATYAAGDCHVLTVDQATCSKGNWGTVNCAMVAMVSATLYFTYQDHCRRRRATQVATRTSKIGSGANIELGNVATLSDDSHFHNDSYNTEVKKDKLFTHDAAGDRKGSDYGAI